TYDSDHKVQDSWKKPHVIVLKCNIGAVWSMFTNKCGVSGILRDHTWRILFHSRRCFPVEAELFGMFHAVKIGLCVESARDAMLYPQRYPHVNKLIEATYGILQNLSLLSWEHSYPSGNRAAMEIAASVIWDDRHQSYVTINGSVTFFPARRVARE
ncbi:hypothetical protein HID58_059971, partial [Brassica napus]